MNIKKEVALVVITLLCLGSAAIALGITHGIPIDNKFVYSMFGIGIGLITFASCLCMSNLFASAVKEPLQYSQDTSEETNVDANANEPQEANSTAAEQNEVNANSTGKMRSNILALTKKQTSKPPEKKQESTDLSQEQLRAIERTKMAFDNFVEILNSYNPEESGGSATVPGEMSGSYFQSSSPVSVPTSQVKNPSTGRHPRFFRQHQQEMYPSLKNAQPSSELQSKAKPLPQSSRSSFVPFTIVEEPTSHVQNVQRVSPQALLVENGSFYNGMSSKRNSLAIFKKYFI